MKEQWIERCLQIDLHQNLNFILMTIHGVLKFFQTNPPLSSYLEQMEKIYYTDL